MSILLPSILDLKIQDLVHVDITTQYPRCVDTRYVHVDITTQYPRPADTRFGTC